MVRAALVGALVEAATLGDVDLAANYWLDARLFAGLVEVHHAIHGAVIGDCQGVHSQLFSLVNQVGNPADAIQHTVLSVDVQVGKSVVNNKLEKDTVFPVPNPKLVLAAAALVAPVPPEPIAKVPDKVVARIPVSLEPSPLKYSACILLVL